MLYFIVICILWLDLNVLLLLRFILMSVIVVDDLFCRVLMRFDGLVLFRW